MPLSRIVGLYDALWVVVRPQERLYPMSFLLHYRAGHSIQPHYLLFRRRPESRIMVKMGSSGRVAYEISAFSY